MKVIKLFVSGVGAVLFTVLKMVGFILMYVRKLDVEVIMASKVQVSRSQIGFSFMVMFLEKRQYM